MIANDSVVSTSEVLELRSELAKSNVKIAEMDRRFAQLNPSISGKISHGQKTNVRPYFGSSYRHNVKLETGKLLR